MTEHSPDLSTPCIPSINKPNPTHGYAVRSINGRRVYEHVLAWEELHGRSVPEGMVIDHLCHDPETCPSPNKDCPHRRCRNPLHLAVVTRGANVARAFKPSAAKTHCSGGHERTPENTYVYPSGIRSCRICRREAMRRFKSKNKGR